MNWVSRKDLIWRGQGDSTNAGLCGYEFLSHSPYIKEDRTVREHGTIHRKFSKFHDRGLSRRDFLKALGAVGISAGGISSMVKFAKAGEKEKDTLVIAQISDATTLDPHNHNNTFAYNVSLNINETLFQRSPDLEIKPLLAASYNLVNNLTWEFKLREGVRFHNGEVFDAASVKLSLERMADPKNKLIMTILQVIDRVEIINHYTVRVITKQPFPLLRERLTSAGGMLPPMYFQEKGPVFFAMNPVGTGPYKFSPMGERRSYSIRSQRKILAGRSQD